MKSFKMRKGSNASKKVGNHCHRHFLATSRYIFTMITCVLWLFNHNYVEL